MKSGLFFFVSDILLTLLLFPVGVFAQTTEAPFIGPKTVKATRGLSALPAESGQYWMTYDISPYTAFYPNVPKPQQTILNWILFDTGEKFWYSEPFAVLNASKDRLYVYHNDNVQRYVSNVLDRFLEQVQKKESFTIRILAVTSPEWKSRVAEYLVPYPVNTKDVQGWLLTRETVDGVIAELARRTDCIELNPGRNTVSSTETFGWVYAAPVRNYVRDVRVSSTTAAGYVADPGTVDEGYRFEIIPLLSTKGDQVEFLFRCESLVVEKMHSYGLKIPTVNAPRQMMNVELPQILRCERKDKISYPKDRVFLLDLGMIPLVASGTATDSKNSGFMGGVSRMISGETHFKNVLVFIQCQPTATTIAVPAMPSGQ